jgi:type IV pilus assembly protein PilV
MSTRSRIAYIGAEGGFTMLEVLITIVILTMGLLGVAGLQARMQAAEMESYQRAQAIVLLDDIVARINANRKNSMSYVTATPLGTGQAASDCSGLSGADLDLCVWNNALLGASETSGGHRAGAMIGARGCITNTVPTMPRQFLVSVVWQGLAPTLAPTATTCGQGSYGNDATRRAIVATVMIGCLQNDPATGLCVTP